GGSLLVRDDIPSRDESVKVAAVAARSIQAQARAPVHIQWPAALWQILAEATRTSDLGLGRGDDVIDGEAELLCERLQRRRGAEGFHAEAGAVDARVPLPPERRGLLHRDACLNGGRDDAVAVLLGL